MNYIITVQDHKDAPAKDVVINNPVGVLGAALEAEARGYIVLSYHSSRIEA